MRKTLIALAAATAVTAAASAPASAQGIWGPGSGQYTAPVVAGVVVGTVVGVGLYNNWLGRGALVRALPGSTLGGALTTGFIAGVGTVVLIDMFTNPCQGLRPLLTNTGCAAPAPRRR